MRHFEQKSHPHTRNLLTRKSAAELRYFLVVLLKRQVSIYNSNPEYVNTYICRTKLRNRNYSS